MYYKINLQLMRYCILRCNFNGCTLINVVNGDVEIQGAAEKRAVLKTVN